MTKKINNKKNKKNQQYNDHSFANRINFKLKNLIPITENQKKVFEAFSKNKNLLLTGTAGTGKSFISIYLALKEVLEYQTYKQVIIVRSIVSSRDIGFLPGSIKEKIKVYEAPYYAIFTELFGRNDAYHYMKSKGVVDFMSTSFVRGITINDAIIIVDEAQNLTAQEWHSIMTRVGKNSRIIFVGDIKQNDLNTQREKSGFYDFLKIVQNMYEFEHIEFDKNDIIRSNLVKSYILTRELLEEKGLIACLSTY